MDFTNIKCLCCKDETMGGAGGQFGGRITIAKLCCPECGLTIMIIPMKAEYQYCITATTQEERKEERVKKAIEDNKLKLAEEITAIKNSKY